MLHLNRVTWLVLASGFAIAGTALAQEEGDVPQGPPADPAALKAFTEIVQSYRQRSALTVKSTVKIELKQGETKSNGSELKAEFTFGPRRTAVLKLRGFTCYVVPPKEAGGEGTIIAIHDGTDHSYFSDSDGGSAYYKLLSGDCFFDLPFPELAIELGEDAIDDVLTQFHPKAPWLKPTAVKTEEKDGKTTQLLTLASQNETLEMVVDPATKLIQSMDLRITGGDMVPKGTTLTYHHTYEYQTYDKPLEASVFTFDAGKRQRVDMMASLQPKPVAPEAGPEGPGGEAVGALEGKPAPPIVLATADGKAIDLNDLKGRVVVVDFWATWCPPCRAALPKLHEVAKWAKEQELPVTVVALNCFESRHPNGDTPDNRLELVRKFWADKNFTLPVAMDFTDETAKAYGVNGIPATFVIRSDGVIYKQHTGAGADYAESLKRDIQEALKAVEPGAGDGDKH